MERQLRQLKHRERRFHNEVDIATDALCHRPRRYPMNTPIRIYKTDKPVGGVFDQVRLFDFGRLDIVATKSGDLIQCSVEGQISARRRIIFRLHVKQATKDFPLVIDMSRPHRTRPFDSVVATGIDVAENVVPFSDTDGSERLKSFDLGWRRAGSGGETSSVLAMSDAIREGLAAPQPGADQPEPDIVAQAEQPPVPVAQTAPGSSDASPPRFQAGYSSKPIDDGRAVPSPGDVARAEIDDRHPEKAPAFRPADRDGSPVEDRRGADIAGQVKATLKDGMGVFERMMAGVKSARQANRANPHLRRAPVLPVIDRSQPVRSPQKPETEPPAQELATPNDSLLPVSEDEEQLEIPAFLRRQAN